MTAYRALYTVALTAFKIDAHAYHQVDHYGRNRASTARSAIKDQNYTQNSCQNRTCQTRTANLVLQLVLRNLS